MPTMHGRHGARLFLLASGAVCVCLLLTRPSDHAGSGGPDAATGLVEADVERRRVGHVTIRPADDHAVVAVYRPGPPGRVTFSLTAADDVQVCVQRPRPDADACWPLGEIRRQLGSRAPRSRDMR